MSVPMDQDDPYALVPELGDLLTIVSDAHGTLTGRIHYRDCQLLRVKPTHVSDRATDFPIDPDTGLFREILGVTEIIMHEKARYAHFSKQLAVVVGERLEFFTVTGAPAGETGVVAEVLATDTEDAIRLEDGRILNFDFLGPPPPIEVIRQRAAEDDIPAPENNSPAELEIPEVPMEEVFPEIDYSLLPAAMVDEVPTAEQTFSDSLQREDMFVGLLRQVSPAQQKNPRVLRQLYRITDLLLAMKNSVIVRDAEGTVQPGQSRSYQADTIRDALAKQPTGAPLAALLPVADVKKVLYTDTPPADLRTTVRENVSLRSDIYNLNEAVQMMTSYRTDTGSGANPYLAYLDYLLGHQLASFEPASAAAAQGPRIQVDQDVLRSVIPPAPVEGLTGDLPSATAWNNSRRDRIAKRRDKGGADPEEQAAKFLVTAANLGRVQERSARLLGPTTYRNPSTGQVYQLAPADVATTVGHVVLTPALAAYREPTRSSMLLWDIQASERSRAQSDPFYTLLMASWGDQRVLEAHPKNVEDEGEEEEEGEKAAVADIPLLDVLEGRLTPATHLAQKTILHTLDALGLRNLELDAAVYSKITDMLVAGRQSWDKGMTQLRARALAALSNTPIPVLDTLLSEDPLWTADVLSNTDMQQALEVLKAREAVLSDTQLARASFFGTRTQGTLAGLWYALAAGPELRPEGEEPVDMSDVGIPKQPTAMERAQSTYRAEKRRLERAEANVRAASAAIHALPDLNSCQHVHLLESIRSIRDTGKRMAIFEDFVTKYRSGQRNNWIVCGSCDKNLVCRHELLLLHEFQHPGRGVALHKALLLEFGGPVFEGAYICKNCGQKIAELEYDSHLEFDDEGRPLVGRAVVAEEEGADEGADEGAAAGVMEEEGRMRDTHGFTDPKDVGYFYLARTILEHCGITPTDELYQRIVKGTRDYMNERVPPKVVWEARQPPKEKRLVKEYENFVANTLFGTVGALIVLEILTTDIAIPFPMHGCTFQRGGFPLETEGSGTLDYVACVTAGVIRNDVPWTQATWASITNLEKRKSLVVTGIRQSMMFVLAIQPAQGKGPAPLTTVTEFYKTAMAARRNVLAQQEFDETGAALASRADRLPESFRPLQVQPRDHGDATAVRNTAALMKDATSAPIAEILPVIRSRLEQVVREQITKHHVAVTTSAKSLGVLSEGSPRSDAMCCIQRVGAVALQGLGVQGAAGGAQDAEESLLAEAGAQVRRRDPAASANGSHVFVPWSAPPTYILQPAADPSTYYRLFLKCCARGEKMGSVHEWGEDLVCRQCHFALPSEFTYLTAAELAETNGARLQKALDAQAAKRKELALAALAQQGISVDEAAFQTLNDAIYQRKQITAFVPPTQLPFLGLLDVAQTHLEPPTPLLSSALADWQLLKRVMTSILSKHLPHDSTARRADFSAFVRRYDEMSVAMEERLLGLLQARYGPTPAQRTLVKRAMEGLQFLTGNAEGAQAARNLITHFVVPMEQVAKGAGLDGKVVLAQANKWFPRINKSHASTLENIWDRQARLTKTAASWLERLSAASRAVVVDVYERMAAWMGPWCQLWVEEMRVGDSGFSAAEYTVVLRWSLLHVFAALLTEESGLYASAYADIRQPVIQFNRDFLLDLLSSKLSELSVYQMSTKQVQESLLARQELEKNMFIQRFDKLDREMRQVELMKKRLKIGDWAVGTTKNLFSYDADFYEFERSQRAAMGLPEFISDITQGADAREGVADENPFGLGGDTGPEAGYDHRAVHDEDAE